MYQKNHSFLIDIFVELQKEKPGAILLLIGEGKLEGQIREKAQRLEIEKSVIFAGARDDVNKLYSVMDVFCLPSFYEGMPVVAWEAQANGLPCAFSDKVSKEVEQGENCCFLDLTQAPDKWASALLKSRKRMKSRVPDIQKAAKRLELLYQQKA